MTSGGLHLSQDMKVNASTTYSMSGRLQISDLVNAKASVFIYFFNDANTFLGVSNVAEYAQNMGYSSLTNVFTTPTGTTRARIHIRLNATAAGGKGTLYADSFTMKQEIAVNTLLNGGFEDSTGTNGVADNWSTYADPGITPAFGVVTWPASAGKRAQKLAASNIQSGGFHVSQDTLVKGGTTYSVSGRLRIENLTNAQVSVFVYLYDAANNFLGSQQVVDYAANMEYTGITHLFTTPASATQARVHIRLNATSSGGGGTIYADSFALKQENTVNGLINGGFEDSSGTSGVADNWNYYADPGITPAYQVVTSPLSGSKRAQKLSAVNIQSGGLHLFQDTLMKGNTAYRLSGMIRADNLGNARASVFVYFYDAANNYLGNRNITAYTSNTNYTSFSNTFTSPAAATRIRIHIRLDATAVGGGGTVYADEFALIKT